MTSGYLSSAFDLLNVEDLDVIAQARQRCDSLLVGVYSDAYVARINGRPPVVPLVERLELIRHVRGVDQAVVHDDLDPDQIRLSHTMFRVRERNVRQEAITALWIEPTRRTQSLEVREAIAKVPYPPADAEQSGAA